MDKHDEIKNLLKASRNMLYSGDKSINEDIRNIKKRYGIISEQQKFKDVDTGEEIAQRVNVPTSVETEIEFETDNKSDKKQSYRISGGILTMHGKDQKDLQITTLEKQSFQETMDEFVAEVSNMVDFNALNVYQDSIEWSGKLIEFDLDFIYRVGETNGVYVDSEMVKVDDDFDQMIDNLRSYYEKFKSKWAKIIAQRKRTDNEPKEEEQ
jgi:flagellin-specific chaperone FliS